MELFKRTGSDDFPSYLKMMISGPPKSGKSTLLGTVPNIVIADTEPHANNLQSIAHKNIPYVTVQGSDDLQRLLFVLRDETFRGKAAAQLGIPAIEAVAIDTLDTLQSIMKKERMRATGKDFLRDDWSWIKEQMTEILQAFTALPMHTFFTVHTKSKEIGKGDDARTIILPGLEGSIAESIAGMVGYSVLTFRKEEIRQDGSKYTKYWLRTEGDETYDYLGNRTAGRLPEVIEPDFATIFKAAMDGRPKHQPEPVQLEIQTTQAQPQQDLSNTGGGAQSAQQPAAQTPQTPPPGDDEPVNAAALMHVKKTYDALGLKFPEEIIKGLNLGQARQLVQAWRAAQQDEAQGKGGEARTVMCDYLGAMGWIDPADRKLAPRSQSPGAPESLEEAKTIEQVLAWAGDDLQRIQQAYDTETANDKPRSSLVETLVRKGAKTAPVQTPVEAPVQPAPSEPTAQTTPAEEQQVTEQAVATVQQSMNGQVTGEEIGEQSVCVECGKPVDDVDIAKLSDARYHKVLCVNDYIAETKKIAVG
jgi:hypothetical protein